MGSNDFLGRGMKFPIQIDPATGRIQTADKAQSVKESIYLILMTRQGERLVNPSFGSRVDDYVFMDVSRTNLTMLRNNLTRTILSQEPRVSDVSIGVEPQLGEGRLIVNVDYTLAATNTRDNLVFPFYLDRQMNADDELNEQEVFADEYADITGGDFEDDIDSIEDTEE